MKSQKGNNLFPLTINCEALYIQLTEKKKKEEKREGIGSLHFAVKRHLQLNNWISQFTFPDSREWNVSILFQLFDTQAIRKLSRIHISAQPKEDKVIWTPNSNGEGSF